MSEKTIKYHPVDITGRYISRKHVLTATVIEVLGKDCMAGNKGDILVDTEWGKRVLAPRQVCQW